MAHQGKVLPSNTTSVLSERGDFMDKPQALTLLDGCRDRYLCNTILIKCRRVGMTDIRVRQYRRIVQMVIIAEEDLQSKKEKVCGGGSGYAEYDLVYLG